MIRVRCHSALAAFSAILSLSFATKIVAQMPAPSGVVANREGVDASGKAVRRYPIRAMTATTQARVRELIAARYPDVSRSSSDITQLTFVLGPNQTYVGSMARSSSSAQLPTHMDGAVAFLPSEPRSVEYITFAAGRVGPKPLRVTVINVM